MENSVKKKKSKKGLRKRVGIIAVGGLSLVLTVCLSVGATLAWFAGSTWASKSLYMGGPVYVEMAGRGLADGDATPGDGTNRANWKGGDGSLDIKAAASRGTGTVQNASSDIDYNDILLPGQKVQIYSQARVYSTAETTTVKDDSITNESSGANTGNTSTGSGVATYRNDAGRVTTTTTSVLRARFSIEVQFDPGMGFNNFTDTEYMSNYPVQSESDFAGALGKTWTDGENASVEGTGRRDGVAQPTGEGAVLWTSGTEASDYEAIRLGTKKSVYKWKYVSSGEYAKAVADTTGATGMQPMGAPFDGKSLDEKYGNGGLGFYGVWITDGKSTEKVESDAFYKARCNSYLNTYKEFYINEYGNTVTRTVSSSVKALEDSLNEYFVKLVNDSSDAIHAGQTSGFKVSADGQMTDRTKGNGINASWLYIDPSIGNDTNTDEISTSVGGWWYLVEDDGKAIGSSADGDNLVSTVDDKVTDHVNTPTDGTAFSRKTTASDSEDRLLAKLYEVKPNQAMTENGSVVTVNNNGIGTSENVVKMISESFPFVNGTFALPTDALTNIFANAKISFKVAFQALQAFFPYTTSIDGIDYTDALLGNAKALNIKNAIPIYNEAFDYFETNVNGVTGL